MHPKRIESLYRFDWSHSFIYKICAALRFHIKIDVRDVQHTQINSRICKRNFYAINLFILVNYLEKKKEKEKEQELEEGSRQLGEEVDFFNFLWEKLRELREKIGERPAV